MNPSLTTIQAADPSSHNVPEAFDSSLHLNDNKFHILLAASGSVATIKIPNIIDRLSKDTHPISIRLILTTSAAKFLNGQSIEQPCLEQVRKMPCVDGVYLDEDEWAIPWTRGAKILHIELRRWADIMIVAPLSANTMAKMVAGFCDNLLLSTLRAWDSSSRLDPSHCISGGGKKAEEVCLDDGPLSDTVKEIEDSWSVTYPLNRKKLILVAPAMNTAMWLHPITQRHIKILEEEWGDASNSKGWIRVLRPMEKELACGDIGSGAMMNWELIVREIVDTIDPTRT